MVTRHTRTHHHCPGTFASSPFGAQDIENLETKIKHFQASSRREHAKILSLEKENALILNVVKRKDRELGRWREKEKLFQALKVRPPGAADNRFECR